MLLSSLLLAAVVASTAPAPTIEDGVRALEAEQRASVEKFKASLPPPTAEERAAWAYGPTSDYCDKHETYKTHSGRRAPCAWTLDHSQHYVVTTTMVGNDAYVTVDGPN